MGNGAIPYSRGQLIHGDQLYLKKFDSQLVSGNLSGEQLLKMVVLSMSFGYFDYVAEILKHPLFISTMENKNIPEFFTSLEELSRRYGRLISRREFFYHLRLLGPYIRCVQNLLLR